jgi:hypothetical protein
MASTQISKTNGATLTTRVRKGRGEIVPTGGNKNGGSGNTGGNIFFEEKRQCFSVYRYNLLKKIYICSHCSHTTHSLSKAWGISPSPLLLSQKRDMGKLT